MSEPFVSARPRFKVNGTERADLGESTLALTVHLPLSGMAAAELRLLNWGPGPNGQPDFRYQDIAPGGSLEIALGEDATAPIFKGDITAIEERYGDGAPQTVLLAEDALHKLARVRKSRVFEAMSLTDVVSQVVADTGLSADAQVSSAAADWLQINESDLAFLLRQLQPLDVALRLQGGTVRAKDEEVDPSPLQLDPGRNALRIRIIADLNRQPKEVAVAGHDLKAGSDSSGSASSLTPSPAGSTARSLLTQKGWEGDSTVPHPFARSQTEAQTLAERQYRQAAKRFLHGEIVCRDAYSLTAGREVELTGVSPRLAGRYRVVSCRHVFDQNQGLSTHLKVERPDWTT